MREELGREGEKEGVREKRVLLPTPTPCWECLWFFRTVLVSTLLWACVLDDTSHIRTEDKKSERGSWHPTVWNASPVTQEFLLLKEPVTQGSLGGLPGSVQELFLKRNLPEFPWAGQALIIPKLQEWGAWLTAPVELWGGEGADSVCVWCMGRIKALTNFTLFNT